MAKRRDRTTADGRETDGISIVDPDSAAIRRILAGDADSYAEVVARNEASLRRLIVGFVVDVHLAEDILQEVFWIAYRRLGDFQHRARFRTWIGRIAVREALGAKVRLRGWMRKLDPLSDSIQARDASAGRDDLEAGLQLLAKLPRMERVALVLHAEGYDYEEIAKLCKSPIGTVGARIHRARRRLVELGGIAIDEPYDDSERAPSRPETAMTEPS